MPNSLYEKYLRMSKQPRNKALLTTIREGESSQNEIAYYTHVGGETFTDLSSKPRHIVDVNGTPSSASGAYQFNNKTWDEAAKALGLKDFSKESQDAAAMWLADKTGAVDQLNKGNFEKAIYRAGTRWAGLPKNEKGESIGKGQVARNPTELKNLYYERLNVERADQLQRDGGTERQKIKKEFYSRINKINNDKSLDPISKNILINSVIKETRDAGNLEVINRYHDYMNNNHFQILKDLRLKASKYTLTENPDGTTKTVKTISPEEEKKLAYFENQYTNNLPNKKFKRFGRFDLRSFDDKVQYNIPDEEDQAYDDGSGSGSGSESYTSSSNESATTPKETPWTPDDLLGAYSNREPFADPEFQYEKGKFEFPMDALVGLSAGIIGIEAAKEKAPQRDEQVGIGLMMYANELAQIKNMGLSPEVEGDLKMKLASAYQTGLTNIVRASNGNRNLVLGNQGQLDMARMRGIVDIAHMDLDRRDKAMAAYGEVQKYISEFNANRDIANNEREYREVEKKQLAGAALAEKGFSNLIDSLQNMRENGPGSINDRYRQYLMFHMSGINPGVKDDGSGTQPGTPSYAEKVKIASEERKTNQQKARDYVLNMDKDEQQKFDNFRKSNPKFDPKYNPNFSFTDMIESYENQKGADKNKDSFNKTQGVADGKSIYLDDKNFPNEESISKYETYQKTKNNNGIVISQDQLDSPGYNVETSPPSLHSTNWWRNGGKDPINGDNHSTNPNNKPVWKDPVGVMPPPEKQMENVLMNLNNPDYDPGSTDTRYEQQTLKVKTDNADKFPIYH